MGSDPVGFALGAEWMRIYLALLSYLAGCAGRKSTTVKGAFMQNITIGRYEHESVAREYAGWIEGIRNDGSTWIMWLDENGSPTQYFAHRDVDGGIESEAVTLS